jgi:uncharacterized 2Fe-2S/4Fe-4S cluster protein (DUF4445 family)
MKYPIEFEPIGRRGEFASEQSLLESGRSLGVDIVNICGGATKCGKCKVQLIEGTLSEITDNEKKLLSENEIRTGYRLACASFPMAKCKIRVPPESLSTPQRVQTEGIETEISPEPAVKAYDVQISVPTLEDLTADTDRVFKEIREQHNITVNSMDIEAMREISPALRKQDFRSAIFVRENEIIAIKPPGAIRLGLAVDIGTTKIACYLVDLKTGKTLASKAIMNPQVSYGEDVITRIVRITRKPEDAIMMQRLDIDAINEVALEMCSGINAKKTDIIEAVIAANTCIHHLFLRLPVTQLGKSPYIPAVRSAVDVKARDIGLDIARGGYVHALPNIAGFVGADHVAMLLASNITQKKGVILALDMGTNTEICLSNRGEMTSVSSPSGPVFEGAHIKHGMRASEGSIEYIRIENNEIEYQTIGNKPPVGICGSAILDAVAELFKAGILDQKGTFRKHKRVRNDSEGVPEFLLVESNGNGNRPEITITQKDIRQVQLAKGAISAAIQLLLRKHKL